MGDGDEFKREGPQREAGADGHHLHRHLLVKASLLQLQRQDLRGEGRAIDGAFELRPEPGDGTQVIFMRMGEHDAVEARLFRGDEADVGKHHIDAGVRLLAELDAEIDHQPVPVIGGARAIAIAVHADLARAAQRQEDEFGWKVGSAPGVHVVFRLMASSSANVTSPA